MEAFLITLLSVLGSPPSQSSLHCCSCYQEWTAAEFHIIPPAAPCCPSAAEASWTLPHDTGAVGNSVSEHSSRSGSLGSPWGWANPPGRGVAQPSAGLHTQMLVWAPVFTQTLGKSLSVKKAFTGTGWSSPGCTWLLKVTLPPHPGNGSRGLWEGATALPGSPHLSSSALLPLLSGGWEVPGGAAAQLPLPSRTDCTMATGSTGGSEQPRQPGRGTSGSVLAFTPGLTGSSLISIRHFSLHQRHGWAPHTAALQRPRATGKGRSMRHCFHFPSNSPRSFHFLRWTKEASSLFIFSASSRNMLSWNICSHFISYSYN